MTEEKTVDTDLNDVEDTTKENGVEITRETLSAQKKHFQDKSNKLEAELKELREANETKVEKKETDPNLDTTVKVDSTLKDEVSLIKFSMKHSDLPSTIVEEAYKISKAEGITPEEVLEKPYMKLYIEDEARKESVNRASNTGSRSSIKTDKPLGEYDRDEHEALYNKVVVPQIK